MTPDERRERARIRKLRRKGRKPPAPKQPRRTAAEYAEIIEDVVAPELRAQVGKIVWWSAFGHVEAGSVQAEINRDALGMYVEQWIDYDVDPGELRAALVAVGFKAGDAAARAASAGRVERYSE